MKRFLTIAAVCTGLILFSTASTATAGDVFYGGHGVYQRGHGVQLGGHHGYGHGVVGSYYAPSYGHGSHHGVVRTYRSYQPAHRGGHARSYRSYGRGHSGGYGSGLHLDVGRLQLGIGGHH